MLDSIELVSESNFACLISSPSKVKTIFDYLSDVFLTTGLFSPPKFDIFTEMWRRSRPSFNTETFGLALS
jgi:hypothetical protein